MEQNTFPGLAISPIDGRYQKDTFELVPIFSEFALMKNRLIIEVRYLLFLLTSAATKDLFPTTQLSANTEYLNWLCENFTYDEYEQVKQLEETTKHDLNAVVYYLHRKLKFSHMEDLIRFVHIGRTSMDIDTMAYALSFREGVRVLCKQYENVIDVIRSIGADQRTTVMLARTHGQPASPTTLGWEMKVYIDRMEKEFNAIETFQLSVKFNGATGGDNALYAAYPTVDWKKFSQDFIETFNEKLDSTTGKTRFTHNHFTTQIEPHDTYRELFDRMKGLNTILIGFTQDMWTYISRDMFIQKPVEGEVGSSAMPQKINPINFENAEGNLGFANSHLEFYARKLPISRLQRDLSDSTVQRNFGYTFALILISLKAIQKGLARLYVNTEGLDTELNNHWEVIAEGYQTILRREGITDGYELMKELTRGNRTLTKETLYEFVKRVFAEGRISMDVANELYAITPHKYIGNRSFS